MTQNCLVCNKQGFAVRNCAEIVRNCIEDVFLDNKPLPSGGLLIDTINEILDKKLDSNIPSKSLCRKCYKLCVDYDAFKLKMITIKKELLSEFVKTSAIVSVQKTTPKEVNKTPVKIVVPASKLQPLPADFQLKFGKVTPKPIQVTQAQPLLNLKVTIGTSVLTQSLTTSTVKICKPLDNVTDNGNNITEWILPNDIFNEAVKNEADNSGGDNDNNSDYNTDNSDADYNNGDECDNGNNGDDNNDNEHWLEIEQNTTMDEMENNQDLDDEQTTNDSNYINVKMLQDNENSDANSILKKLQLLDGNNDDGAQTIVLDGDNNSILEMIAGQKLIYENGELSLVMQDDDESQNDDTLIDSNDEDSQIELQVSGDEETAKAIIAAAQEHGGAFIKMKDGQMYRVKSVQSKPTDNASPILQMVTKEGDYYKCLLCEKSNETGIKVEEYLGNAEEVTKHLKSVHDAILYICQLCGQTMTKQTDYTAHIAEHTRKLTHKSKSNTKSKQHECNICDKSFTSKMLLQEHINGHTGNRPYVCDICSKTFASKYTHQTHLKTHQNRPRPFKCTQCNKSFFSQQNLTQHEKTHLGIKNFVCNVCNKAFGSQHNLEVHSVVHSGVRAHGCEACGKRFARRAELRDHTRTHTGERPFACHTCGARFAQRSNLHSHTRATHRNDKRHACTHCDKRFKRRRLLEYHIKAAHTGERSYKCEICHSTFVYPEHYKKHIKIHTGERPYHCEICGKSFNSRDNRNTHRFVHSDKKPYECLTCGASYMRKRLLLAHMNTTGHIAESIVVNQPRVTRVNENGLSTMVDLKDNGMQIDGDPSIAEAIFKTSGELKLLTNSSNDDKILNSESGLLQTLDTSDFTGSSAQMTDENGSVLRLIQIKLPDGNDGWVALND